MKFDKILEYQKIDQELMSLESEVAKSEERQKLAVAKSRLEGATEMIGKLKAEASDLLAGYGAMKDKIDALKDELDEFDFDYDPDAGFFERLYGVLGPEAQTGETEEGEDGDETETQTRPAQKGPVRRSWSPEAQTWKTQKDPDGGVSRETYSQGHGQEETPDQQVVLLSMVLERLEKQSAQMERLEAKVDELVEKVGRIEWSVMPGCGLPAKPKDTKPTRPFADYIRVPAKAEVLAIYASGFPVNCVHAVGTFIFLMVLANPMIEKLERIRRKYGMIESGKEKKQ